MRFTDYGEIHDLVASYDELLDPIDVLVPSSANVFKVRRGNELCVLKVGSLRSRDYMSKHLVLERDFLAEMADVPIFSDVIEYYPLTVERPVAILKPFVAGSMLGEFEKISDMSVQDELLGAIACAHKRGFYGFDLLQRNILISSDNKNAKIIDPGPFSEAGRWQGRVPGLPFLAEYMDLYRLNLLFR
jgi:hypothetical protein